MNVFLLLNLIRLELRSASESVQPVKIIWVGLKSNKVRLTKSSASEPGLKWSCFVQKSLHNNNETFSCCFSPCMKTMKTGDRNLQVFTS